MSSITFYPKLDEEMADGAGIITDPYELSYRIDGRPHALTQKGKRNVALIDPLEIWRVETEGLELRRSIIIEYPQVLYGARGIACKAAEIGVCLIWTNTLFTQMGYILPEESTSKESKFYEFSHVFAPGDIAGDLTIEAVLYIKEPAANVGYDERHLINEAGVVVGVIDSITIKLSGNDMVFPIVDINDKSEPLWWLDISGWEDPTSDPFNEDYVCLYLNNAHPACPKAGSGVSNEELLIEIVSTAYLMIFQEISRFECLDKTLNNIDLEPGSIAKVMQYFADGCDPKLQTGPISELQKTIRINVERMLKGADGDEVQ